MKYVFKLKNSLGNQHFWNILILLIFFPLYLYFIQTNRALLSIWGFLGVFVLISYMFIIYRSHWRSYQIPVHFMVSAILFTQVIKGNTIPLPIIVIVLGVSMFLVQDIISNQEYKRYEIMRQVILSGIVFISFSTYAFLFGSIFITNISPIILSIIAFITTINLITYTLWMYGIKSQYYKIISLISSIILLQIFIVLRILPFSHLTQSMIMTTYLLFSISIFRDIYFNRLRTNNILGRLYLLFGLIGTLIFTSVI